MFLEMPGDKPRPNWQGLLQSIPTSKVPRRNMVWVSIKIIPLATGLCGLKDLDKCNVCHMDEEDENNMFLQCDKSRIMDSFWNDSSKIVKDIDSTYSNDEEALGNFSVGKNQNHSREKKLRVRDNHGRQVLPKTSREISTHHLLADPLLHILWLLKKSFAAKW